MSPPKNEKNMSFFEHLDELRLRVFRSILVFGLGFALVYLLFRQPVMDFLRTPLFNALPPEKQKLYFTGVFENFLVQLKISGYSALFFLAPYFFWEIWGFVSPGLRENERKWVIPFIVTATFFFIGGAAFAYYVLFPTAFNFFLHYGSESDVALITIDSYYGTALKLLLLFGLAFELPVIISLLGFLGVIDSTFLKQHRRHAILGITLASAVFAPPDMMSMVMLMIPLIVLYEFSILAVEWLRLKRTCAHDIG